MSIDIHAFIASIVLIILLYGPIQSLIVDMARQRLFSIRDKWFDFASEGKIAFNDPAYIGFRGELEHVIRFSHKFTWVRIGIIRLLIGKPTNKQNYADPDDREVKDTMRKLKRDALIVAALLIWWRSPFLVIVSPFMIVILGIYSTVFPAKFEKIPNTVSKEIGRDPTHSMGLNAFSNPTA